MDDPDRLTAAPRELTTCSNCGRPMFKDSQCSGCGWLHVSDPDDDTAEHVPLSPGAVAVELAACGPVRMRPKFDDEASGEQP